MYRQSEEVAHSMLNIAFADMGPRATGKEAVATVVVDKMRRRMRQNGYHAHLTLQVLFQHHCWGP
jgi:hypothetical protein